MRQGKNPVFRRVIVPWYDSDRACWIVMLIGVSGVLFGAVGMRVALENPEFEGHLWMPALLFILSAVVVVSTAVRLIRRRKDDPSF
ncbi:MAG: hypothetical protein ACOWWM_03300 [Desulfobacterales bacterium]